MTPELMALIAAARALLADADNEGDASGYASHVRNREALRDALQAAEAAPIQPAPGVGWIACSDTTMPPHGYYLVTVPHCARPRLFQWYAKSVPFRWYDENDDRYHGDVTHWMPLPPPPGGQP